MSKRSLMARIGGNWTRWLRGSQLRQPRLAVFFDGDGISPAAANRVIEYLPTLGRITILRTYGNFTGGSAAGWNKLVRKHGMVARHMPSIATEKNAADIALAIDAIETLLTRDSDTFVLIAGDADFTPLVHRIREQGKDIIGIGSRSAAIAFRGACTVFMISGP